MLEVGVSAPQPPGAKHHCQTASDSCSLNRTEWQTHFSAWAIVSAPLILGMDLRDQEVCVYVCVCVCVCVCVRVSGRGEENQPFFAHAVPVPLTWTPNELKLNCIGTVMTKTTSIVPKM